MKKIISFIMVLCLMFVLVGCGGANPGDKNYEENTNGRFQIIPSEDGLYYDVNTKVVYVVFSEKSGYAGYGYMSPYCADNGLPYRYNVEDNKLEKVKWSVKDIVDFPRGDYYE